MRDETLLAQVGSRWDERTGSVSMPIYQSATFRHPALGKSTGFDYSRTSNPTRLVLEQSLASLDGGVRAFAFGSGLAAIDAVLRLFVHGDMVVVTEDLYGGTFRLLEKIYRGHGVTAVYVDTSDLSAVCKALRQGARGIFVESPTNPLLKIADLAAIAAAAKEVGALTIVDNTFLTGYLQKPIALGVDLVVYSATKYLAGHNDVVAGCVVASRPDLAERIAFCQNAIGAILGPQDAWLILRGLKTLALRLQRQLQNAEIVAAWLARHPRVQKVFYPGLPEHPGRVIQARQAKGYGAMIAFEIDDPRRVSEILARVKTFLFAESLGGVESLITFPMVQTHADIDASIRERLGINDRLLRLSIGVEDPQDLIADLAQALI